MVETAADGLPASLRAHRSRPAAVSMARVSEAETRFRLKLLRVPATAVGGMIGRVRSLPQ
ncbi:MAG: hypothetical protein JO116_00915 [Planctomycetaceae bacterium]|nr:hypothetical protein [Planctomycetaceae bacterium]